MRGKLTIILFIGSLAFASAALAATSPPVGGGHYKGHDDATGVGKVNRNVTMTVTKNKANFARARMNFVLKGQVGLGSCAGPAFITITPTKSRQITPAGTFDLHGHFTFKVATPYGAQAYKTVVTIKGAFSDHGKKVGGTLVETATHKKFSCHSGTVHFTAALTK
jgi:hypothetical protein